MRAAAAETVGCGGVPEHYGEVEAVFKVDVTLKLLGGKRALVKGVAGGCGDQVGEGSERGNAKS